MTAGASIVLVIVLPRVGVVDNASQRSSHVGTVPRGGGLAVVFGTCLGSALLGAINIVVLLPAIVVGAVGLAEDLVGLAIHWRLLGQTLAGIGAGFLFAEEWPSGALVVVLGLAILMPVAVNTVNFMDGINGISVIFTVIVCAWCHRALVQSGEPVAGAQALSLSAACFGFLFINGNGRLFLGDVGSYFLGGMTAGLTALAILKSGSFEPLLPLALYFTDVGFTLLRRGISGEKLTAPHRDHIYQRLSDHLGHIVTSAVVGVFSLIILLPPIVGWSAGGRMCVLLGVCLTYLFLPSILRRVHHEI